MFSKTNCSMYDPCGTFGHCEDDSQGQVSCLCKFWWEGTLCNKLTNAGKQIVVLSVITIIIVIYYYYLNLQRWFRKRSRQPVKSKSIDPIVEIVHEKSSMSVQSNRMFQWTKGMLAIIIGIFALIIKGILLKGIHQEIVDKFQRKQPLFYEPPSFCRIINLRKEFNILTFPLACLLIVLFTILTKRKASKQDSCCRGYMTIPVPLDFFAHVKRTFAAIIFAVVADELANIANQFISESSLSFGDGAISTYLLQILRVLIIGFHCYPILAAIYINTRFTLLCAVVYAWFDFSLIIGFNDICRNNYYSTKENFQRSEGIDTFFYLKYYGTGSKLIFFQLLINAPRYFCLAYICVELPILFFQCVRSTRKSQDIELTVEQNNLLYSSLPNSTESHYVANLFRLKKINSPVNWFRRRFRPIYTWRDDFRFSSRIFCVYASIFLLIYFLTVQACVLGLPYLAEISGLRQTISLEGNSDPNATVVGNSSFSFHLPNFVPPYLFAISTAFVATMIQLFVLLTSIRRNLLQAFRGDDSEIPRCNARDNINYARNSIHFAGYLIGYVLWGYVLIGVFALIAGLIIDILITYGLVKILEIVMKIITPSLLLAIFQYYSNQLLGQYVFLQKGGDILSINHRRILMVYLYFNFFLDAFLGFISSIIRVVKSAVGGMIYMCRLDYSSLGRKLETYDAGFSAYCGFIHMECAHRHPVLLYFTSLLIRQQLYENEKICYSKARRRWYLAIFLLRNPTLVYRRRRTIDSVVIDETKLILIGRKNVIQPIPTQEPSEVTHVQHSDA